MLSNARNSKNLCISNLFTEFEISNKKIVVGPNALSI